jgi:predicted ATPase
MIESLRIRGYRSLRDVNLPLGPLTVVTGGNGTGKSNLYRCLQVLSRAAHGELARALAEEGGMPSVLWSGVRRSTNRRPAPVRFGVEVQCDTFGYALTCGLPIKDERTRFHRDPEVKTEQAWLGRENRPSVRFLERDHASASIRGEDGERVRHELVMEPNETALSQVQDARRYPDLQVLRAHFTGWRFYHHFRCDPNSPLRQPRPGTRTPRLASDGHDLASALQTIREIGDDRALTEAIDRLQSGARLEIADVDGQGSLDLRLLTPGLLRPVTSRELSDGTLRYLALIAALLSPRPAPLLAFNEPESSLHPDMLPALAQYFVQAAERSQVWVTTHSAALADALTAASGRKPLRLELVQGATRIVGQSLTGEIFDE